MRRYAYAAACWSRVRDGSGGDAGQRACGCEAVRCESVHRLLTAIVGPVFACPPAEFGHEFDQVGTGRGEPVVCGFLALVVLDQASCLQVLQGPGQRLGVDDGRAGPRHGVQELGVSQRSVS